MLDKIVTILLVFTIVDCYILDPGPVVIATKGAVWPAPFRIESSNNQYGIRPMDFRFKVRDNDCSLLQNAITRYWSIIRSSNTPERRRRMQDNRATDYKYKPLNDDTYLGYLDQLDVVLTSECTGDEIPHLGMVEDYKLTISPSKTIRSVLLSSSIWGIMRGLETFSQLIHFGSDDYSLVINATEISDFPRFSHRGLLLDTSRHFLPVYSILQNIDAMAYNKLNVFHWHIVDDHSFPYQSYTFPELSDKGAYHAAALIYTQADVKHIIEHARQRGIRVMPEFDTPGHTRSWGEGVKGILTPCYKGDTPTGKYGPMDPSKEVLYTFVDEFFKEVINVFPDKYMHLGGDEVEFECWQSNPNIRTFMDKLNITGDYAALESYYIQKLLKIIDNHNGESLVWEEVFVNGVAVPNNTIVHVWKDDGYTVLKKSTKAGKPSLLSSCWYLDHLATGGDWQKFYACDPHNFDGTDDQKKLVLGGEACMWGESVNEYNVASRIWPRASATAEKLWSQHSADTASGAARRLEEHTCRMNQRGIPAQPPNGPGYCL